MLSPLPVAVRRASGARRLRRLLDAIPEVESAGDDLAVGDLPTGQAGGGLARGAFQIHLVYWADAIRRRRTTARSDYLRRVWSRASSEGIVLGYWRKVRAVMAKGNAWPR